jgi:hypothetical protein
MSRDDQRIPIAAAVETNGSLIDPVSPLQLYLTMKIALSCVIAAAMLCFETTVGSSSIVNFQV